jgi:hypothetical protein
MRKASKILILAAIAVLNIAMFVKPPSHPNQMDSDANRMDIDSTKVNELPVDTYQYRVHISFVQR